MRTRRKTMKGGNLEKAQRRIDKWVENGDFNKTLDLSNLKLITLPIIPDNVKFLWCNFNKLTSLPNLPNTLQALSCINNKLSSLPTLPNSLKKLYCHYNKLTSLPELPNSLKLLTCEYNKLTTLPSLPNSLEYLWCYNNKLTTLPKLPEDLEDFDCNKNQLPKEYYKKKDENMEEYIQRIRELQSDSSENINSSETKEVNSNARNYIAFENIKNGNVLVNLKRSANKYNSNYKEYITKNTYNTMLHKTLKHPLTRYTMKRKNVKYYTAKKNNNSK